MCFRACITSVTLFSWSVVVSCTCSSSCGFEVHAKYGRGIASIASDEGHKPQGRITTDFPTRMRLANFTFVSKDAQRRVPSNGQLFSAQLPQLEELTMLRQL